MTENSNNDIFDDLVTTNNQLEPLNVDENGQQTDDISKDNLDTDDTIDTIDTKISTDNNIITEFLKSYGIQDPSKIKYENDEGVIEEINFNDLNPEEQFTILKEITDPGLNEHEISTIDWLRKNNVTFEEAIEYFSKKKLDEYLSENPDSIQKQVYSIDDYTDDELYVADTKSKFPSLSDDELTIELDKAKENEDLFKKKVQTLRESYKAQEDEMRENERLQSEKQYEDLKNDLSVAVNNLSEISLDYTDPKSDTLLIEDEDRRQILSYLLDRDSKGISEFVKDLEDPSKLVQLAWYMKQGKEVFSGISKYWKDTLKKERQEINKLKKEIDNIKKSTQENPVNPSNNIKGNKGLFDEIV